MNNDACYSKESWINHSVNNLLSKASTKPIRFPLSNIGFNNSILIKNKKAMKVAKVSHTIQWIANVYRVKYYRTTTAQNRNLCSCTETWTHTMGRHFINVIDNMQSWLSVLHKQSLLKWCPVHISHFSPSCLSIEVEE